ncbi:MAG: cmpB [Verrucomicrobiales bacterium]|nr:cmpB [Verrucomicrobiales bacterium]
MTTRVDPTPATTAPLRPGAPVPASDYRVPAAWLSTLGVSAAALVAIVFHLAISKAEPAEESRVYSFFVGGLFVLSLVLAGLQRPLPQPRSWARQNCPIFIAAILLLAVLEGITTGWRLLPLPYFPSPARVLWSIIENRAMLWNSTWHSLLLLLGGYLLGVVLGIVSCVCIGWF